VLTPFFGATFLWPIVDFRAPKVAEAAVGEVDKAASTFGPAPESTSYKKK